MSAHQWTSAAFIYYELIHFICNRGPTVHSINAPNSYTGVAFIYYKVTFFCCTVLIYLLHNINAQNSYRGLGFIYYTVIHFINYHVIYECYTCIWILCINSMQGRSFECNLTNYCSWAIVSRLRSTVFTKTDRSEDKVPFYTLKEPAWV